MSSRPFAFLFDQRLVNLAGDSEEWMLLNCDAGGLLRVPWTARRSNQSILKDISPEYLLEGLMLKLQYFGHLMQRANSWKRP